MEIGLLLFSFWKLDYFVDFIKMDDIFNPMRLCDCHCYELLFSMVELLFVWLFVWIHFAFSSKISGWIDVDFKLHQENEAMTIFCTALVTTQQTTQKTWPNAQDSATSFGNCFNKCKEFTSATLNVVVHLPYFNRAKIYFRMHKFMLRRRSMFVCVWMDVWPKFVMQRWVAKLVKLNLKTKLSVW